MSRRWWQLLLAMILVGAFAYLACNSGGDDDDAAPHVTPPPGSCTDNTAPVLSEVLTFTIHSTTPVTEFMETETIEAFVSYTDAECNVHDGQIFMGLDGAAPQKVTDIDSAAPCSAQAANRTVGFPFVDVGVGQHQLSVYVMDFCGAQSNTVSTTFTLTPYQADDDTADDDAADDDTVSPTLLQGEVRYTGDDNLAGRPVTMFLFKQWLPHSLPVAVLKIDVPDGGFPFPYEWNMDEAQVEAGAYFLAAFLDAVDGDGYFNAAADPFYSPYLPTEITANETTTQNVTLVAPGR